MTLLKFTAASDGRASPAWLARAADEGAGGQSAPIDGTTPGAEAQAESDDIVAHIPAMRIFARSLCRNTTDADDLVQETLVRAIANIRSYHAGTHMRAWLFTIMRNRFYTNWAKRARERTGEAECASAVPMAVPNAQLWHLRGQELQRALSELPIHYREAILLVGVLGESYKRAAEILDCDIGTIKSRVNRARAALRAAIGGVT